ncbi:MAG: hypothetical protein JW881_20635 [Spirochaetales bacterium]|nr:hypothetical protein [Spirochaetales bacterium]
MKEYAFKKTGTVCAFLILLLSFFSCPPRPSLPPPPPTCAPTAVPCVEPGFSFGEPEILDFGDDTTGLDPFTIFENFPESDTPKTGIGIISWKLKLNQVTGREEPEISLMLYIYHGEDGSIEKYGPGVTTIFPFRSASKANLFDSCNLGLMAGIWNGYLIYGEIEFFTDDPGIIPNIENIVYGCDIGLCPRLDFAEGENYPTAISPFMVDIDNNGSLDAFLGSDDGRIYYYKNTGEEEDPFFEKVDDESPFGIIVEDEWNYTVPCFVWMEDRYDLFISDSNGNIHYFRNYGTREEPLFNGYETNPFGLKNVGPDAAISFFDIDNDCDLDAFVGYSTDYNACKGEVALFRNNIAAR